MSADDDFELPCKRAKLSDNSSIKEIELEEKQCQDISVPTVEVGEQKPAEKDRKIDDNVGDLKGKVSANVEGVFPTHTTEKDVAITQYIGNHDGFHGVLKQRFVDFLVNERDVQGNLVQLTNMVIPLEKNTTQTGDTDDELLSEEELERVRAVMETEDVTFSATLNPDEDKQHRTRVHKFLKKKFPGLDTTTVSDDDGRKAVKVFRYHGNPAMKRQDRWPEGRGNYCKFVLHKENKDTMEAICLLAKLVHVKPAVFGYAGTKDRRGVTSQEVRAYRVQAQRLKGLNKTLKGIWLGNFEYSPDRLTLGQLSGNHFVITLRNVIGSPDNIGQAMESLKRVGFINYFGLQRFGTAAIPTHHIGRALLLSQWSKAVHAILSPKSGKANDFNQALEIWRTSGDAVKALQILTRHKCIENTLLQGLVKHGNQDLVGALQSIPRNTRLMYVHAYQSYIWNNAASWRIKEQGLVPVEGDLVIKEDLSSSSTDCNDMDILADDACHSLDDANDKIPSSHNTTVHTLTAADIQSARYSLHDVVMPLPGYDVTYPGYNTKEFYKELMDKDGIDINNLRHKVKEYSLSGAYRKLVVKPRHTSWRFLHYDDSTEPLALTDIDKFNGKNTLDTPQSGKYLALQIELSLPPSCYATMAVREVLKCETSSSYQATLNTS